MLAITVRLIQTINSPAMTMSAMPAAVSMSLLHPSDLGPVARP